MTIANILKSQQQTDLNNEKLFWVVVPLGAMSVKLWRQGIGQVRGQCLCEITTRAMSLAAATRISATQEGITFPLAGWPGIACKFNGIVWWGWLCIYRGGMEGPQGLTAQMFLAYSSYPPRKQHHLYTATSLGPIGLSSRCCAYDRVSCCSTYSNCTAVCNPSLALIPLPQAFFLAHSISDLHPYLPLLLLQRICLKGIIAAFSNRQA